MGAEKATALLQVGKGTKAVCQAGEGAVWGSKIVQGLHMCPHLCVSMHLSEQPWEASMSEQRAAVFVLRAPCRTLLTVRREQ